MSKFYGQVEGMAQTIGSRRGSKSIKSSVQSYDGSIINELSYNKEGALFIEVFYSNDTTFYGSRIFSGTVEEYLKKLQG